MVKIVCFVLCDFYPQQQKQFSGKKKKEPGKWLYHHPHFTDEQSKPQGEKSLHPRSQLVSGGVKSEIPSG